MDKINIDQLPETNVDWFADGERANAATLNRPIKQVAAKVNELSDEVNLKLDSSLKGSANGLAELNSSGQVPTSQLPSYVDDVLEYTDFASFPATGETGKIYIDLAENSVYRWSGSTYIEIVSSAYAMDQNVRTTDAVTFAQVNADNIRIDGNTISSTDTNGNITLDPNGTGTVELVATTNVTGAMSVTVSSGTSITAKTSTSASTASIRVNNDANTGVSLVAYGSTYAGGSIMGVGANGTAFNADGDIGINAGSAKTVRLGSGNSERMRILANGNVHIGGTSDPGVKLGVTGAISATGNVRAAGIITTSAANTTHLANSSGQAQLWGMGSDTSTNGSVALVSSRSDTSNGIVVLNATQNGVDVTGAISATTGVAIGTISTPRASLDIKGEIAVESGSATTSTTSQTEIDSYSASTFKGCKAIITVNDGTNTYVTEMLIANTDSTVTATEYGQIGTGGVLSTFDVDVSGGNVRILATPASSTSTTFKVSKQLM